MGPGAMTAPQAGAVEGVPLRSVALVAWIMGIVASGSAAVSLWAGASRAGSLQRAGHRLMGNQRAGHPLRTVPDRWAGPRP